MARRLPKRIENRSLPMMSSARSLIPIGVATLLPDAAQRVRHLEGVLFAGFAKWGYREIIPPTFEYLDVLSAGLPAEVLEKCYKFPDWTTGRILVLRPDVTAQIARTVAMGMAGQGLPLRLCYRTTVFRHEPEHAGREREVFQVGVELIGADDASMDAEILTLLMESLKSLGLAEFKISLGHVGFYKALLARSRMSDEGRKQAEVAAAQKDLPKLEGLLSREGVPKKVARPLLEAPGRYGRDEVLKWGRSVAGRDRALAKPIGRLAQVYHLLEVAGYKNHLLLDLGEFRGFDYYDGLVFDVFAGSLGCELGGGGRYDHLIGRFGRNLPSTGFALDVNRLFGALEPVGNGGAGHPSAIFLSAPLTHYGLAFKTAQLLRSAGLPVLQEVLPKLTPQAINDVRERARQWSVPVAVFVGLPALGDNQALVVKSAGGPTKSPRLKVLIRDLPKVLRKAINAGF